MKMLAKLATAALVAALAPASGLVSAQFAPTKVEGPRPAAKAEEAKRVDRVEVKGIILQAPAKVAAPQIHLMIAQPAVAIPVAPAGAGAAPDLGPLTKQMVQNLRPLFRAEMRFFSAACDPLPDQRRSIALEVGVALKDAARQLAEVQHALQNGGWRGGVIPDARKIIREAFENSAKAHLPAEKLARYRAELDGRKEDQRRAIALNLVANMDRLLVLGPDQRTRLADSLLEHWDERTFPTLENIANYEAYFPNIPDKHITPILSEAQRKAWQGAQKVTFGQSFNFFNNNGVQEEPEPQDEDEKAALAEEEVKKP